MDARLKPNPAAGLKPDWKPEPLPLVEITPAPLVNSSVSWFDVVRMYVYETLVSKILSMKGGKMQDPKTTVTAIITAVASLLSFFGIVLPESAMPLIIAAGVFFIGLFAKDATPKNETGR